MRGPATDESATNRARSIVRKKEVKGGSFRLFTIYWIPPLLLMSLIFYLSSLSGLPDFQAFDLAMKKGAHLTVYALLYFLLFRAFHALHPEREITSFRTCLWAGIGAFLYAVSDEVHQSFVPFRTASAVDVAVDSAGILLMYLVIRNGSRFVGRFLRQTETYDDSKDSSYVFRQ